MEMPLRRMHAGGCAVVKLIAPENRMPPHDVHDHANIDLAAVGFLGRDVELPRGVVPVAPCRPAAAPTPPARCPL